jgi:hypothetical protein
MTGPGGIAPSRSIRFTLAIAARRNAEADCDQVSVAHNLDDGGKAEQLGVLALFAKSARAVRGLAALQCALVRAAADRNALLSANASGKQTGNMKLHRSGICRQVSQPIF